MRHLSLLLLSLAACGGSSKSTIGNIAGAGGPPGPAPTVAWSGGAPAMPYSDPAGPDASALVWAFVARQFEKPD